MQFNKFIAAAALTVAASAAQAAFVPVGVQNDLSFSQVTGAWGWSVAYSNTYGSSDSIANVFANVNSNQWVMIASRKAGTDILDVAAAAKVSDVQTYTALNTTHAANGAEWYYNGYSMGFAGLGLSIYQTSADVGDAGWGYYDSGILANARSRLSWHTSGQNYYNGTPDYVNGGWRSGNNVWLNDSSDFERYVFVSNGPSASTPEPTSLLMMGLGLLGLGFARKRAAK